MLLVTKVFHFETAHAIFGYQGLCKNIHGHSYELHVTIGPVKTPDHYLDGLGIVFDFKDLKRLVSNHVLEIFDHKLLLSKKYVAANPHLANLDYLDVWDHEPTAENILIYIKEKLQGVLPQQVKLVRLKIFETKNSYAEWISE